MDGFPEPDVSAVAPEVLRLARLMAENDPEEFTFNGHEVYWIQFATALSTKARITELAVTA